MEKDIFQFRDDIHPQSTIGSIYIDNKFECYSLEDTIRPFSIKVKGYTAIPAISSGYYVTITHSNKFDRDVLMLCSSLEHVNIIDHFGITFSRVYSHGGNRHEDTEGCILVAKYKDANTIYGTHEGELFDKVKAWLDDGYTVRWKIFNHKINP